MKTDSRMSMPRRYRWFVAIALIGTVAMVEVVQILTRDAGVPRANASALPKDSEALPGEAGEKSGEMTGRDILLRSREAYDALTSYRGTIVVQGQYRYVGRTFTEPLNGSVSYSSPNRILISWREGLTGMSEQLVCDGERYWAPDTASAGSPVDSTGLKDLLVEWTGVSSGITTMLPAILLRSEFEQDTLFLPAGERLTAFAGDATLVGKETIDGHECYRVECNKDVASWTFWVDTESHLLRRVQETVTTKQMAVQRTRGGGGASGEIVSYSISQAFTIDEIDGPIDQAQFSPPD
jgi:hypothetical protein